MWDKLPCEFHLRQPAPPMPTIRTIGPTALPVCLIRIEPLPIRLGNKPDSLRKKRRMIRPIEVRMYVRLNDNRRSAMTCRGARPTSTELCPLRPPNRDSRDLDSDKVPTCCQINCRSPHRVGIQRPMLCPRNLLICTPAQCTILLPCPKEVCRRINEWHWTLAFPAGKRSETSIDRIVWSRISRVPWTWSGWTFVDLEANGKHDHE